MMKPNRSKQNWENLRKKMLKFTSAPPKKVKPYDPFKNMAYYDDSLTISPELISPGEILTINSQTHSNNMAIGNYSFSNIGSPYGNRPKMVIFFGFTGLLPLKFSYVEGISEQEVDARLQFANKKLPWKVMYADEFMPIFNAFRGTPNALQEIGFDDALNTIRIGIQKTVVEVFEEPEKDEFDDNCIETCKPGNHACGKK